MAISFYVVLLISGGNDVVADKRRRSASHAMTWGGRVGLLIILPIAYYVTYRICLGLQQHDREVLAHGVETGIIKRQPDGRFIGCTSRSPTPTAWSTSAPRFQEDEPPRGDRARRAGLLLPIEKPAEPQLPPAATRSHPRWRQRSSRNHSTHAVSTASAPRTTAPAHRPRRAGRPAERLGARNLARRLILQTSLAPARRSP